MLLINQKNKSAVKRAIKSLDASGVLAIPTDTVYGLAVDASNYEAVEKLYSLKKRDYQKPIAIFVKDLATAQKLFYFEDLALEIASKHFSKPLTMILKIRESASKILASNLNLSKDGFIGFRIVDSFFVKKLFENYDGILAVTSANKSGEPPAGSALMVKKYFDESQNLQAKFGFKNCIDLIIEGESSTSNPSTVIKIFNNKLSIIRSGDLDLKKYEH